jgi:hypothetical protein
MAERLRIEDAIQDSSKLWTTTTSASRPSRRIAAAAHWMAASSCGVALSRGLGVGA